MSTTRRRLDPATSTKGLVATVTTVFAASMLALTGTWQVLAGITAIARDDIYVRGLDYTYALDLTAWGWIYLALGALAVAIAAGIFVGRTWAVSAGIGVAVLSALGNFAFLPYYPLWALVILAFDALVIWALCQQLTLTD